MTVQTETPPYEYVMVEGPVVVLPEQRDDYGQLARDDARSRHAIVPMRLAEAREREAEQGRADAGEREELRPDDVKPGAAEQDRLRQHDEMGGRARPA